MSKKAIFLDRDGTINVDTGYLSKPEDIELLDNAVEGLKAMQSFGYLLIIVTNQSGIARGYFGIEEYLKVDRYLKKILLENGVTIQHSYYCPHHIEGKVPEYSIECNCRKPRTGLIEQALLDEDIDLKNSFVIGDKESDVQLGKNVGARTVLIGSKYNCEDTTVADFKVKDLLEASYIISDSTSE